MKKRVLNHNNLDAIGTKLLNAARVSEAEIEDIISRPQLFDSIVARIKAEEANRQKRGGRRFWLNYAAGAIVLTLIIAAVIFYTSSPDSLPLAQNRLSVKPQIPAVFSGQMPASLSVTQDESIVKTTAQAPKSVRQKINSNRRKQTKNPLSRKTAPVLESIPDEQIFADEGKFYVLPFAGDFADDDVTQIVRVELSSAELSALGIEFPLAGNEQRVLTDLSYGASGNPKAFRLIGKL